MQDHNENGCKTLVVHTWNINNFTHWDTKTQLQSHGFVVESMLGTEFYLTLSQSTTNPGRVDCYLDGKTCSDGATTCRFGFEISILAEDGSTYSRSEKEVAPFKTNCSECVDVFGLDDDLEGKRLVPNDVLTLVCRMWEVQRTCMPNSLTVEENIVKYRSNHYTSFSIKKSREVTVPKAPVYDSVGTGRPLVVYDMYVYHDAGPKEMAAIRFFSNTARIPVLAHITIHLLDSDKRRCMSKSEAHLFVDDLEVWYFPEFIPSHMLLDNKKRFLPDDRVSIEMDMLYTFTGTSQTSYWCGSNSLMCLRDAELEFPLVRRSGKRKWDLKRDMQTLLKKGKFTDLVLTAEGQHFPAHKAILSSRSSVFEAMFGLDMAEKQSNVVDIQDMDSETLGRFLGFLYSEEFPDDTLDIEGASKLYSAADKYDIRELRVKCSEFLGFRLTPENACEVLTLAHFHGDRELKKSALKKISACIDTIILTDEWTSLVEGESTLAETTMHYLRCKR